MVNIVGRENELRVLLTQLKNTASGKGSTIFISGEAGTGKTKLAEECVKLVQSWDFKVLMGFCLHNSVMPYMSMREALKSCGLEHLIASDIPPKLETVFLITNTGIMLSKCERDASPIDCDIFAGMLTAVTAFIKDGIRQMGRVPEENISTLRHGSFNILTVHGKTAILAAAFSGWGNEFLLDDMETVLEDVENRFGEIIQNWSGKMEEVEGTKNLLSVLFESEKYEGIDWARGDPKSKQSNIFENVTRGLVRAARTKPMLLLIDDLQWADSSTLALLHYISRNTKNSRILIIGTYRPEDIVRGWDGKTHQLTEIMQLMNREELLEEIELKNLKEDEVKGLIGMNLGKVESEHEFAELVWRESQGNPLYVLELMNLLKEENVLVEKEGRWRLIKEQSSIEMPSKIHDVIARRLARLEKEQRQLLETASVIGEAFTPDVLGDAAEVKSPELLRTLDEIEKVHGLIRANENKYRFSHVKIREVLYTGISEELRREYHLLVGDTINELYGDGEDTILGIGYHYYMAKNPEKAVPHLMKAIELVKTRYSNAEAVRYCRYALELMNDEMWLSERIMVLENLGDMQELTGNYEDAIKYYKNVLEITEKPEIKARMCRKIGGVLEKKGEYDMAFTEVEKGIELIGNEKTPELGRLISLGGSIHERRGNYDGAFSFQNDALKVFEKFEGTDGDVAGVLNRIGVCHWYKGAYAQALEFHEKSLKLRERNRDQRGIGGSYTNIGAVFYSKREYAHALEFHEKSLKLFEKTGDQRGIGAAYLNIGLIFQDTCEYDKALEFYEKSLKLCEKIGDQQGISMAYNNIGIISQDKCEYDKALEFYEKSLKLCEKNSDQQGIGISYNNIGLVFADKGVYDKAMEHQKNALEIFEKIGRKEKMIDSLSLLSEALLMTGEIDDAEERANRALEVAREIGVKEFEGIPLRILGMVETERKEWNKSEKKFEGSIFVLKDAGLRKELAMTYLEYGRMLKLKGDMARAKETLNESLRLYEEIKLPQKIEEAMKELDELEKQL